MTEVEDHEVGVFETRDDRAVDLLGSGEEQVTLQLVERDGGAAGRWLRPRPRCGRDWRRSRRPARCVGRPTGLRGRLNKCNCKSRDSARTTACRALLPRWSSGGENTPMASGRAHGRRRPRRRLRGQADVVDPLPALSYMPHVVMTLSTLATWWNESPLARDRFRPSLAASRR